MSKSTADPLAAFSEPVRNWFGRAFERPTPAQAQAWPAIAAGEHVLLCAPTGSGKTLAAFLWGIDTLGREPMDHIDDVRWQPNGQLVALIDNWQLYIVNANGADLHKISFAAPIVRIGAFTWSPDGARFAFRAVTNTACHFAMREDSFKECTTKSAIFTSSVDGSMLKKIKGTETAITTSQYQGSSLFWIK